MGDETSFNARAVIYRLHLSQFSPPINRYFPLSSQLPAIVAIFHRGHFRDTMQPNTFLARCCQGDLINASAHFFDRDLRGANSVDAYRVRLIGVAAGDDDESGDQKAAGEILR